MKGPGHEPLGGLDAKIYRPIDQLTLTWINFQMIVIPTIFLYRIETQAVNLNFQLLLDTKFPPTIPLFLLLLVAFTTIYYTKRTLDSFDQSVMFEITIHLSVWFSDAR